MKLINVFSPLFLISTRNKSTQAIMKYLNVAEKNDAAKHISQYLSRGASTRREGYSQYNKIYEFDATVLNQPARMVITSVSGHLLNYEFVSTFRSWQSCNPEALFDAPVIKSCSEDFQKIKRTLEREVRSCQGLIIWTDCDREGENIGFEIITVCKDVKPNLRIYRAKFSEITAVSVFRALNNLVAPNKNISDAVDVRQELDLRTGAAFTRLQTLRLQRVFPQKLAERLISYGSCQFPTLGFVVDRYKTIEEFIPEPFWKIKMSHTIKDLTVEYTWDRGRLFSKNACEVLLDCCKDNSIAMVEKVESKPKSKWRPLPLDTVEMEKNISRKLKINAKDTMKIAEKLYTQGFISYPRTETNIYPKELNLTPLVEQQQADPRWGPFAARVMGEMGGPNPRQGKKTDNAHPPIHPTKHAPNLQGNEQRVYEYITRHFLACVSKDALGHETTVNVDIAREKFTAKGLLILERNYLDVYIYEKWNAKEIHEYVMGQTFTPDVLEMVESATSAPSLLTEADLIALMEKHGIGTDATHADHIDTIKSREYVGLQDNMYFVPGTLGMGLVEGYNNIGLEVSLAKPNLRADFEKDLKLICDGLKDPGAVLREQVAKYRAVYATVTEKILQIDQSLANRIAEQPTAIANDHLAQGAGINAYKPILKCPKCGKDMILKTKKDGLWAISCIGFPDCKNFVNLMGCINTAEVTDESCAECGPGVKKLKFNFRRNPFHGEPNPNIYCIGGCAPYVLETLDIPLGKVRRVNHENDSSVINRTINVARIENDNRQYRPELQVNNQNVPRNSWTTSTTNFGNATHNSLNTMTNNGRNNAHVNDEQDIVCACNQAAVQLTVRKEGPNTGRKFYKCSKGKENGGCDFFLWASETDGPTNTTVVQPQPQWQQQQNRPGAIPKCQCNLAASLKTVQKDGPNKGKKFYTCSKPMGSGCTFFKWADEVDEGHNNGDGGNDDDGWGGGTNTTVVQPQPQWQQQQNRPGAIPKCQCNLAASLKTVQKDGPNKGKKFYTCSKPMGSGCKFFKWADEVDEGHNNGDGGNDDDGWGGGGGGLSLMDVSFGCRGNATNSNTSWKGKGTKRKKETGSKQYAKNPTTNGSKPRGKRKCGLCGEEGHTRNKCPNA